MYQNVRLEHLNLLNGRILSGLSASDLRALVENYQKLFDLQQKTLIIIKDSLPGNEAKTN